MELEEIDLSGSAITSAGLNALLKAVRKVKTLKLSSCNGIGDLSLEPNSLMELEAIDLSGSAITSVGLNAFLKAAPKVNKLDLSSCQGIGGEFSLAEDSLKSLEEIKLSGSAITSAGLNALLKAAPKVKKLKLSYCQGIECVPSLEPNNLMQLEEIDLSYSNITSAGLNALLKAAPKVKTLHLSSCQGIGGEFSLEPGSLMELEQITLSSSAMTSAGLEALLKAAPNLKKLDLSFCKGIGGDLSLAEGSLMSLEKIDLSYSDINPEGLMALYKAAPQLRDKIRNFSQFSKASSSSALTGSSVPFASGQPSPEAPKHDPLRHKSFTPHNETIPFEFKKSMPLKNQGMLIHKLCQYLTLQGKHLAVIPKLQDGICNALSYFHKNEGYDALQGLLNNALVWEGDKETLSEALVQGFESLYGYIETYQLKQFFATNNAYLGANVSDHLSQLSVGEVEILTNPWHAVTVERASEGEYRLYDSNAREIQELDLKDLGDALTAQLGLLIGVKDTSKPVPEVDFDSSPAVVHVFLASGGLLALCKHNNFKKAACDAILSGISSITKSDLDGILLRGTSGTPAWVLGLKHESSLVCEVTNQLLKQFRLVHGTDEANALLSQSMEAMTGMQRQVLADSLTQKPVETRFSSLSASQAAKSKPNPFNEDILALCRRQQATASYQLSLSPWTKRGSKPSCVMAYNQGLLASSEKTVNRLVRCRSDASVLGLSQRLVSQAEDTRQSVFYVDSPKDLMCASPYVARKNGAVQFKKGPGGALYDFLKQCEKDNKSPVIIVNYTRFKASDMVKYNGLLDSVDPRADGTPLPEGTRVIGVLNTEHPDVYQGSDFYSRFHEKHDNPFSEEALAKEGGRVFSTSTDRLDVDADKTVIALYNGPDWKSQLLGTCVLHGKDMRYEEGALMAAIKAGKPIEIENGRWEDEEFCRFWQNLTVGQGVYHVGEWYTMSKDQIIHHREGYDWATLKAGMRVAPGLSRDTKHVLNAQTLSTFIGGYVYNEDANGLITQPSLISTLAKASTLRVNVTSSLSDDIWARILSHARACGVRLKVHCAPGVELPMSFDYQAVVPRPLHPFNAESIATSHFNVVVSTDRDTTLRLMKEKQPGSLVMSVSGLSPEDFLKRIKSHFNKETAELSITSQDGPLITALNKEQSVILTGEFSPAMVQALSAYALTQASPPKVTILSEDAASLACLLDSAQGHGVSLREKKQYLPEGAADKLSDRLIESEPLGRLEARLRYMAHHPDSKQGDEAWAGMHTLSSHVEIDDAPLDFTHSEDDAKAFHGAREQAVIDGLKNNNPYVYLTGLTGVGKTTFVKKTFSKENGYNLFHEAGSIATWAMASDKSNPVLFLDEANMSARDWVIFEGMFQSQPRGMVEKGVFYELSPKHHVIFAGNPSSYGDERKRSKFFERYGSAVLFQPLSKAVLYEEVLKPIFDKQGFSQAQVEEVSQTILSAYEMVCRHVRDEVLLTPRELEMIALVGLSNAKADGQPLQAHINGSLLSIIAPILHENPDLLARLKQSLPEIAMRPATPIAETFSVMESQKPVVSQLQACLALRDLRVRTKETANEKQLHGGLGGIVLEGEPGSGKSELVVHTLVAAGYEEEHNLHPDKPTQKAKPFYKMAASLGLKQKQDLLDKAFNEGAVVIMDEINSSPMMEQSLNAMLMGYHPTTLSRPTTPGFMVLGTQNPISMAGRRVASPALRRRLNTIEMPEYSKNELISVLRTQKALSKEDATLMVEVYLERRAFAKSKHIKPAPCFRDLYTLAETHRPKSKPMVAEDPLPVPELTTAFEEKYQNVAGSPEAIKNNFIVLIEHMLGDIGEGKSSRYTKGGGISSKEMMLTNLKQALQNAEDEFLNDGETQAKLLGIIKGICAIRRHEYNIFWSPHSVKELDCYLSSNGSKEGFSTRNEVKNITLTDPQKKILKTKDDVAIRTLVSDTGAPKLVR